MDFLADFIKAQKIKGPQMKDAPTFYRNLEEALDLRRSDHGMFTNVYDELVHASVHDGMTHSLALTKVAFRHNDVDALRDALVELVDSQPLIKDGSRTVLISVESVYSMDGDVCPLREMLEISREVCPKMNFAFIVDEAHATGIIGPKGVGLVSLLGLEKEIAIRLHTYGKALASTGGNTSQFVFRFCIWA
ncbi:8-amino-7-oxononanoate synthase [Metarhizium anisopliae]